MARLHQTNAGSNHPDFDQILSKLLNDFENFLTFVKHFTTYSRARNEVNGPRCVSRFGSDGRAPIGVWRLGLGPIVVVIS